MKSPYDLERDLKYVLETGEGYTKEIAEWVGSDIAHSLLRQLGGRTGERKRTLRLSSLGTPCERKLWYSVNSKHNPEPLSASALNKFIYGDLTESHVLGLCMAAGHDVAGLQDTVVVHGIRGSRDCVIDGMLFDVKSTSTRGFEKFRNNGLLSDDPFGYLSQLSSYLYGSRDDDLVTYKEQAGFIALDKQFGHISVDIYDMKELLWKKKQEIEQKKAVVKRGYPPERAYEDVPHNKSGNRKLGTQCSYCEFKYQCWPDIRTFVYSNGPVYMTHVEKEPSGKVREVK